MTATRRRLCVLLGTASLAGCTDIVERIESGPEPGADDPSETEDESETPETDEEPTATEEERQDDEDESTPEEDDEAVDLRERESELPELVRESLSASRGQILTALETYASSAGGEPDPAIALESVSLLAEPDRIDVGRELSTAEDRLSGGVSRADRQGIDDEPFRRLVGLLEAEIESLRRATEAHETLAEACGTVESVVELADQRAYRLAEDEHEELGERSAATEAALSDATAAVEPIETATDAELAALEATGHAELVDRLEAGSVALSTYDDALGAVPSAFSDLEDAEVALGSDDDRAFRLATNTIDALEAVEAAIEAAEPPGSVEPLETDLLEHIGEKLERAREVREEADES